MLPTPLTNLTIIDTPFQMPTPEPSKLPTPPLHTSFKRRDAIINFEDLSSDENHIFAGPSAILLPTRNNSLQSDVSHGNMDTSLETHRMLSKVPYDLRLENGKQWSTPESDSSRRDGIFRSVSSLCDPSDIRPGDPHGPRGFGGDTRKH